MSEPNIAVVGFIALKDSDNLERLMAMRKVESKRPRRRILKQWMDQVSEHQMIPVSVTLRLATDRKPMEACNEQTAAKES